MASSVQQDSSWDITGSALCLPSPTAQVYPSGDKLTSKAACKEKNNYFGSSDGSQSRKVLALWMSVAQAARQFPGPRNATGASCLSRH